MTFVPDIKRCKKCGKMYDYDPDVGVTMFKKNWCPECIRAELDKAKHFFNKKGDDEK